MSLSGPKSWHRRNAKRVRNAAALAISLIAHIAVALVIFWQLEPEHDKVGSRELDVELVAPRLATPLDPSGREAKDPGRAKQDGESERGKAARRARAELPEAQGDEAQAAQTPTWQRPAAQRDAARDERVAARALRTAQRAQEQLQRAARAAREALARQQAGQQQDRRRAALEQPAQPSQRAERELKQRKKKQPRLDGDVKRRDVTLTEDPMASLARLQQRAFAQQTLLAASTEALPEGPSLSKLVEDVRHERAARQALHKQALERHRRQNAAMERRFAALAHRTEVLASANLSGAGAIIGESATTGVLRAGGGSARRGGKTPRYGLKFYLSGRRVEHSRVVRPPELIKAPRFGCKVTSLAITPATVRMLVEKDGKVGHAYVKHSSGHTRFDRCALRHARAMLFRPGVDQLGEPLDVWINVRVQPSTLTAQAR